MNSTSKPDFATAVQPFMIAGRRIDSTANRVLKCDQEVRLEPKAIQVLVALNVCEIVHIHLEKNKGTLADPEALGQFADCPELQQ